MKVSGENICEKAGRLLQVLLFASCFHLIAGPNMALAATQSDLTELSLEALMQIEVTTVSRKAHKLADEAAAVYVLTQEDIRRSGHRRLPELMRLVPGMHVAKQSANRWAISSRNSLNRFSSSMLVMIDGRSVYTPFYAGVYWELQDTFLEDIDRIEVVRGPGGALWGANAVDGIINIITKSSDETANSHVYALGGEGEMAWESGVRYGAEIDGTLSYRVFAKKFMSGRGEYLGSDLSNNVGLAPVGFEANDDGISEMAGFRVDTSGEKSSFMLQGNIHESRVNEDRILSTPALLPNTIQSENYNLTFNGQYDFTKSNSLVVTSFFNDLNRTDDILDNDEKTFDIELQHNLIMSDHDLSWGLGYRYYTNNAEISDPTSCGFTTPCFSVDPASKNLSTYSFFFQDRVALSDSVSLILGSKFEKNEFTDFEYQPTIRGLWTPDSATTYWAAATRAVRAPDRVNTDGILDFSGFTVDIGNKDQESYIAYTYELGYRKSVSDRLLLDATIFYSDWVHTLQETSYGLDDLYGFEGYAKYRYSPKLSLDLGYTYHKGKEKLAVGGERTQFNLPRNTVQFHAAYTLMQIMELDAFVYYVDENKGITADKDIPAYTRVDLRSGWTIADGLELSLTLTNLLDEVHAEAYDQLKINSGVRRGGYLELSYEF